MKSRNKRKRAPKLPGDLSLNAMRLRRAACDYAAAILRGVPLRQETEALARLYRTAEAYSFGLRS